MPEAIERRAAILGIGGTVQGEHPGRSGDSLALEAFTLALSDSGLPKSAIDGLLVQESFGGQGRFMEIGRQLGINPIVGSTIEASGATCAALLQYASLLVGSGMANVVACVYGTNQRTNRNRFGASRDEFGDAYGMFNPGALMALSFRRRMALYGETEEQLAAIALNQRAAAQLNPNAFMRTPLSFEKYMAANYLIAPLRGYDFCQVTDGGFAIIVGSVERAHEHGRPAVRVAGFGRQDCLRGWEDHESLLQRHQQKVAAQLYARSGYTNADVDLLYIQDAYTPAVLNALENYGFCSEGEAAAFIQDGRIGIGGELPVNINGGQTSETYMVGWGHTVDAVRQLRGECGERQVADARVAMCTYSGGLRDHAIAAIYERIDG